MISGPLKKAGGLVLLHCPRQRANASFAGCATENLMPVSLSAFAIRFRHRGASAARQ